MKEYEEISTAYRFGRVKEEHWHQYVQKKVKTLVNYLFTEHELRIEGIYLENYKTPDPVIVIDGVLPIDKIKSKFGSSPSFEIKNGKIFSTNPWIIIEGTNDK